MSKKIDPRSSGQLPIPDLYRLGCTSYKAGHNVHWIQALHTANRPEVSAQSWRGQIVTVDGEVLTVRKPDGSLARFRNHDPAPTSSASRALLRSPVSALLTAPALPTRVLT